MQTWRAKNLKGNGFIPFRCSLSVVTYNYEDDALLFRCGSTPAPELLTSGCHSHSHSGYWQNVTAGRKEGTPTDRPHLLSIYIDFRYGMMSYLTLNLAAGPLPLPTEYCHKSKQPFLPSRSAHIHVWLASTQLYFICNELLHIHNDSNQHFLTT